MPGVSQVASVGGFVKQYQITIDPNLLVAYNIPITKVMEAVRSGNRDVEGRVLEFPGAEYMVRGKGYIRDIRDIENIPLELTAGHSHPHPHKRSALGPISAGVPS